LKDHAEPFQCSKTGTNASAGAVHPTAKQDVFETHEMLESMDPLSGVVRTD
jgi:hypothetical protein